MSANHLTSVSSLVLPSNCIYSPVVSQSYSLTFNTVFSSSVSLICTAVQNINGIAYMTGSGSGLTVTSANAADMYNYLVLLGTIPQVGQGYDFRIINQNTNSVSLVGGTGINTSTVTSLTVPTLTSKTFRFVFNSPTSMNVYA